jgi:Trp operon repressor
MEIVRALATPRAKVLMTSTKTRLAESLMRSGYTRAEVAEKLGVSLTTLDRATTEE